MMNYVKKNALDVLHNVGRMQTPLSEEDIRIIEAGITRIEPLRERDAYLKYLWDEMEDVPMNPQTECIETPYLHFKAGTGVDDIWHWFDERYSKGIAALMYGDDEPEERRICDKRDCQFCHNGECRFALVHERKPEMDGPICWDYAFRE